VRIKIAKLGDGTRRHAPEYDDCRRLALASGVALKRIIAEANHAYLNKSR
jgi:uncharacterized protein (DUF111 family)